MIVSDSGGFLAVLRSRKTPYNPNSFERFPSYVRLYASSRRVRFGRSFSASRLRTVDSRDLGVAPLDSAASEDEFAPPTRWILISGS